MHDHARKIALSPITCSTWIKVFGKVRFTRSSRIQKLLGTVQEFWGRETSDDLLFIFLVLIDSFVVEVSLDHSHILFGSRVCYSWEVFARRSYYTFAARPTRRLPRFTKIMVL